MSVTRTTAYPSRYTSLQTQTPEIIESHSAAGKFYLQFETKQMGKASFDGTGRKRELAHIIGKAIGKSAEYDRTEQSYSVAGWKIYGGNRAQDTSIVSPLFDMDACSAVLTVLDWLAENEYVPVDELTICFKPDVYELQTVLNLCNIIQARSALIVQALGLKEEMKIIIGDDLAFGIALDAFLCRKSKPVFICSSRATAWR